MDIKTPNIPNFAGLRYYFDFNLIPSIALSEDFPDFINAVVVSEGQVLADMLNDAYKMCAEDNKIKLADEIIFQKEHFTVITGKVNDEKAMTIVMMPDDDCDGIIAYMYVFTYDIDDLGDARFFTVERNSGSGMETILQSMLDAGMTIDEIMEQVPVAFLCELVSDKHLNYGPIIPDARPVMEKILEILGE